ncbi:MAG: ion channel [Nitrospirota bacterium]
MPIITPHPRWEQILQQRCFLLFLALLALLIAIPFLSETAHGRLIVGLCNIIMLLTAVGAVGRSKLPLAIAIFLAVPTLTFQLLGLQSGGSGYKVWSWSCNAVLYSFTLGNLLHYVLRQDRITADKLYGAVAAYMLIAILWAFLHGVLQYFYPGAYAISGKVQTLDLPDFIYFSFSIITTAGFGDITPVLLQSRFLVILEGVTGVMYVAILIARLTGVYPVVGAKA